MTPVKNVLFISYDGMTDPLGQSQVIPYLQGLRKAGYNIFLLSCEKRAAFNENKVSIENLLIESDIKWIPLVYTKTPPVLSTLWDIVKLRRAALKIHKDVGIDLVHTRPGIPALVGLWLKKKYGIKFLNDIREFFADSRVEGLMWNLNNPVYKSVYLFFKKKELEAIRHNDGIVCLTNAAEKIILQWPGIKNDIPLRVIPCSADIALFDPERITVSESEAIKAELKISKDDLIISYLGSIGGWYMTDEMMEFCKMLSDTIPTAKFLFISPHRHEIIEEAAEKFGISTTKIITRKASRNQVPLFLSLSNYSIFFIKPCYSKLSSSPTKHGEIMAMGIPLITNSGVGDVKEIVEKYDSGYIIDAFSKNSYKEVIHQIDSKKYFDKESIRQGAKEIYALQNAVEKYKNIYKAILGN